MNFLFFRHEKTKDDSRLSAKSLPKNKHSVKGVGKTQPDDTQAVYIHESVEVPLGKPIINVNAKTPLQYNEYPLQLIFDFCNIHFYHLFTFLNLLNCFFVVHKYCHLILKKFKRFK